MRHGQITVHVEMDDTPLGVMTLHVVCEKCGYEVESVETSKWRLANLGPWIDEHVRNACGRKPVV